MAGRNETLEALVGALRAGELDFAKPPEETRAVFEAVLATIPVAGDLHFESDELAGLGVVRSTAPGAASDVALLYLHGGAYVSGSAQGYRNLAAELARASGATGFALEYRLAPEAPFPAAVDDAVAAYKALRARGFAASRIVIAGDSAGGGLALATLVALRDAGADMPAAALLISPWADLTCSAGSIAGKAADDPSLTGEGLRVAAAHYLAGADARHPLASPALADLSGLPPLLVQVGSAEILMDDALAVAAAAGRANAPVRLEIWPGMPHVWHAFAFMLPEGRQAIDTAGAFLRDATKGEA
ncbi:MAG: hypothetical protein RIS94_1425 [Pseudomonadota bacterium]|jgi:acetyl esterase/lipase